MVGENRLMKTKSVDNKENIIKLEWQKYDWREFE